MKLPSDSAALLQLYIQSDGSLRIFKSMHDANLVLISGGLVEPDFGPKSQKSKRKRRDIRWESRWKLKVTKEEALARLAVDVLDQDDGRMIFKGGSFQISMVIRGFELP